MHKRRIKGRRSPESYQRFFPPFAFLARSFWWREEPRDANEEFEMFWFGGLVGGEIGHGLFKSCAQDGREKYVASL